MPCGFAQKFSAFAARRHMAAPRGHRQNSADLYSKNTRHAYLAAVATLALTVTSVLPLPRVRADSR